MVPRLVTSLLRSSTLGCSTWRRLKARSCLVSAAARSPAFMICSTGVAVGIVGAQAVQDQLAVAGDDGQQIIEIVRHAAGQHADRFHLLRLPQLIFQLAAAGDVHHDGEPALRPPIE